MALVVEVEVAVVTVVVSVGGVYGTNIDPLKLILFINWKFGFELSINGAIP